MRVRRFVLTGAPGSGKTTLIDALRGRGHQVVAEAATDVIARAHAAGVDEPWRDPAFITDILALQRRREHAPGPAVRFHDRGPLCTVALARHLGYAEPVVHTGGYERAVFLIEPLGFIERTAARRMAYADAVAFGVLHEQVYREHGCHLVRVPAGPVEQRVALIEAVVSSDAAVPTR